MWPTFQRASGPTSPVSLNHFSLSDTRRDEKMAGQGGRPRWSPPPTLISTRLSTEVKRVVTQPRGCGGEGRRRSSQSGPSVFLFQAAGWFIETVRPHDFSSSHEVPASGEPTFYTCDKARRRLCTYMHILWPSRSASVYLTSPWALHEADRAARDPPPLPPQPFRGRCWRPWQDSAHDWAIGCERRCVCSGCHGNVRVG